MRPKPTPVSSKQSENTRINNNMGSFGSPVSSGGQPLSNNAPRGSKIPWSGIAAGAGSGHSPANSNVPMSFASAAALSMSRSTNNGGRSSIGSPSLSRATLPRSQLANTGHHSTSNNQKKSSASFAPKPDWDDPRDAELFQQFDDTRDPSSETVLLENSGGRNYSVSEMLNIYEDMKRGNTFKPSVEQKNDLFHSILPNQPAVLDHSLHHQPFHQEAQQQQQPPDSASNNDAKPFGTLGNSNSAGNANGNSSSFADRLFSAKPNLSEPHKDDFSQHKALNQSENAATESPASSIVLPGVTSSSWSPFGATTTSLATNPEPVYKTNGILPKNDLFGGGVGFHTSTPPPGIASPMPTLITAENTNWIYKDPSGFEQGPFNGLRMQEWYASKWLQETLLIRRVEETEFYMLKDLMGRVNNFSEPFLVSQLPASRVMFFDDPQQRIQEEMLARQRELLRRQQLQQQFATLQLQQQNTGWGSPLTTPMSPMSPWTQSQPLSQPQPLSSYGNNNPFDFSGLSGSQVNLAHMNNGVWQPRAPGSIPQTPRRIPSLSDLNSQNPEPASLKRSILAELEDSGPQSHLTSHKGLLYEDEELLTKEDFDASQSAIRPPSKPSPISNEEVTPKPEPISFVDEQESVKESSKPAETATKKSRLSKSKGKKSVPVSGQQTPSVARLNGSKDDELAEELTKELEHMQVEEDATMFEETIASFPDASPKPVAPVLAPWAKKEVGKSKAPSLKEIQEIEAAERKTRKAQQLQASAAIAAQISRSGASTPVSSSAPALPSGATWATVGVPSPSTAPKKTLAQIQKEEEENNRKRNPLASAPPSGARRYVDIAAPSASASFFSRPSVPSAVNAGPVTGGAWTTVGPGGKRVGNGLTSAPGSVPPSAASSPTHRKVEPVARVVAATTSVPTGIKLSSSGEEFLNWCKTSLQDLQSGVNQTELLSMLFSLPASSESKEIIAESIYSSSTTMDGRRFAEEFLKRRKTADNEISGNFTWSDVLTKTSTAAKPVSDGWNVSFKVVGKKKGRRE